VATMFDATEASNFGAVTLKKNRVYFLSVFKANLYVFFSPHTLW
jgi:hypothetical protein